MRILYVDYYFIYFTSSNLNTVVYQIVMATRER